MHNNAQYYFPVLRHIVWFTIGNVVENKTTVKEQPSLNLFTYLLQHYHDPITSSKLLKIAFKYFQYIHNAAKATFSSHYQERHICHPPRHIKATHYHLDVLRFSMHHFRKKKKLPNPND